MKINYIEDKEINLDNDDILGTKPYAEVLKQIISTSKTPFTIGLFGGWGVGKSSIIKTIQDNFNNDMKSKITVFTYDAWKYSKDSFRRTFLYELKNYFRLDTNDNFNSFYQDKHEEIETKIGISKHWWIYLVIFILSLFLINFVPQLEGKEFEWTTFVISIFISGLITFISKSFIQYKISITKPKAFAPEKFEEIFLECVNEITKKKNGNKKWIKGMFSEKKKDIEKLVIVIDNIDRCHNDLSFELLLTIKNFLEQKTVIFIIPIAENEIKKHIENQGNDPNEFLRKLFNTTITIKKISEGDLFDFAKGLNDKYKLNLPREVITIVSQEFSKNPRKIIQFLNVLQTELLLANIQEENNIIPKGTITDNVPFLTKLLIIREEWTNIFDTLKEKPYLTNNLYYNFNDGCFANIEPTDEQKQFFRRTDHIKPNHTNFELFFNNKDSFENILDTANKFIISSDIENIKKQIENEEITIDELIRFIDTIFEKALERGEIKTSIVNILSLFFQLCIDSSYKDEINFYLYGNSKFLGGIISFFRSIEIKNIILDINSDALLQFIKENNLITKELMLSVTSVINENKNSKQLFVTFFSVFKETPKVLRNVSERFTSYIIEDFNFIYDIEEFHLKHEIVENLITIKLIDTFVEQITDDIENKDNNLKINILSTYHDVKKLPKEALTKYIIKIINSFDSTTDHRIHLFWLQILKPLIQKLKEKKLQSIIFQSFKPKQQWFLQSFDSIRNNKGYQKSLYVFLENIIELSDITLDDSQNTQLFTWLNSYFSRDESPELINFINNLYKKDINHYDVYQWKFAQNLIDRFNQISDWSIKKELATTLNLMLLKTTKEDGFNNNQILSIYRNYIKLIGSENQNEIIEWFSITLKNSALIESFKIVIDELPNDKKLNIIGALRQLGDDELIETIINEIFEEIDCDELDAIINKLDAAGISKETIRKCIKNVLKEIEKENENFNCFIEYIANNPVADKVIQNLLAEKIKPLIVSENKEEVLFALETIDTIQISDSKKSNAIRTLIQDVNKEKFNKDELDLLINIEKKLK